MPFIPSAAQLQQSVLPTSAWQPYGASGLGETIPRFGVGTAITPLTSGTLYMCAITLAKDLLITSIRWECSTIAMVAGTVQLFGLYDDNLGSSSGTPRALLRGTVDDGSAAWGISVVKSLNLTSTYTTTRAGLHYLAVLVAAATPPALRGCLANTGAGVSGLDPVAFGSSDAGQTSLPNPAATISASGSVQAVWGGVL